MPKTTIKPSKSRNAQNHSASNRATTLPSMDGETFSPSFDGSTPADTRPLPTHEQIAARAYEIAQDRQRLGQGGDEMSDWLQAEAELSVRPSA